MEKKSSTPMIRLIGILLIAGLIRLLVMLPGMADPSQTWFQPDSPGYVDPALALLQTGHYQSTLLAGTPETLRAPGFPALLAVLFGISRNSLLFVALVLSLLSVLTCLPIYLTACKVGGVRAGIIAAGLFAISLTSIANAPLILTDTLFTFLVAWQLYFAVRAYFSQRWRDMAALVTLVGMATYVRPIGIIGVLPCLLIATVFYRRPMKVRLGLAVSCTAFFLLLVLPWMWRNARAGAGFAFNNTFTGFHLRYFEAPVVLSLVNGQSTAMVRNSFVQADKAEFARHPEWYPDAEHKAQYQIRLAKAIIREHPFTYLRLHFQPMVMLPDVTQFFLLLKMTQGNKGTSDVIARQGWIAGVRYYFGEKLWLLYLTIPFLLIAVATYLLACVTGLRWIRQRRWFELSLFVCFAVLFVAATINPYPRFHLPALPLLVIMAALSAASYSRPSRPLIAQGSDKNATHSQVPSR